MPYHRKKKKGFNPQGQKLRFPRKDDNEMLGRVIEILGNDHMRVKCEDNVIRLGRIRGKIKKRMWIRLGEVVIVVPWDWETETKSGDKEPRCDIIWRYRATQEKQLERRGKLPASIRMENM
ncbi:MAG: translation initiation factor eIF-1A [Promethearchaeota archaeon]